MDKVQVIPGNRPNTTQNKNNASYTYLKPTTQYFVNHNQNIAADNQQPNQLTRTCALKYVHGFLSNQSAFINPADILQDIKTCIDSAGINQDNYLTADKNWSASTRSDVNFKKALFLLLCNDSRIHKHHVTSGALAVLASLFSLNFINQAGSNFKTEFIQYLKKAGAPFINNDGNLRRNIQRDIDKFIVTDNNGLTLFKKSNSMFQRGDRYNITFNFTEKFTLNEAGEKTDIINGVLNANTSSSNKFTYITVFNDQKTQYTSCRFVENKDKLQFTNSKTDNQLVGLNYYKQSSEYVGRHHSQVMYDKDTADGPGTNGGYDGKHHNYVKTLVLSLQDESIQNYLSTAKTLTIKLSPSDEGVRSEEIIILDRNDMNIILYQFDNAENSVYTNQKIQKIYDYFSSVTNGYSKNINVNIAYHATYYDSENEAESIAKLKLFHDKQEEFKSQINAMGDMQTELKEKLLPPIIQSINKPQIVLAHQQQRALSTTLDTNLFDVKELYMNYTYEQVLIAQLVKAINDKNELETLNHSISLTYTNATINEQENLIWECFKGILSEELKDEFFSAIKNVAIKDVNTQNIQQ